MKKLLPIMLLVPCVAMGANTHSNAYIKTLSTKAGISRTVANAGPIGGTVKDETGAALPGVSVSIKGTSVGTQTDVNGHFRLNAKPGDVLVFSYIGYLNQEVTVNTNTNYEISLAPNAKGLNEVVVTALGIKRSEASLSYDQQTVGGKELETAKDPSFVNSLQGKVSGLQIQQSSSGAGGSTKVVLRGDKSIFGSSNVLYVVDGVPLNPVTSAQPTGVFSYGSDGGDGISNINPDDIESISVLKGASAAALYGSAGANGVVLITTKKGQAGKTTVTLNSITTFDNATQVPKLQTEYGEGSGGVNVTNSVDSWGAKESGGQPNGQASQFFVTGNNYINSFTLSTGTEKNQTFISYANTDATGIEPGNKFVRNNISFSNTSKMFNDKLTLDISASYISQDRKDAPATGTYFNALSSIYLFPRGMDFEQYKTYQVFDPTRNIMVDNWFQPVNSNADYFENPYWIQYRNPTDQGLNRLLGSITAKYDINSWLYLQGRVKVDATDQTSSQDLYASSNLLFASATGHYAYNSTQQDQVYSDLILNVNKDLSPDFNINGSVGAVLQDNQASSTGFGANLGNIDNYFNVSNLSLAAGNPFNQSNKNENQTQSLFGAVDFGYKKYLFLDLTARNEWNSALAYSQQSSFFYPSVGLSDVLSSMFKMPDFVSYSKVRVSYSDVGNTLPVFITTPAQYTLNSSGFLNLNLTKPLAGLKPEKTHSFEVGMEWKFFNDHLSFDATYYHTNSYNQLFSVQTSVAGSGGYANEYINGGNVQNAGFEGSLGYNGRIGGVVQWNSNFTFSMNKNKVISLYNDPINGPQSVFTFANSFDSYETEARVGHPFGEIYAADFVRDAQGNPVLTGGKPTIETDANTFKDVGNPNPNFILGWNNSFKVSNFDLAFTVDGRFGGDVIDMTGAYMDAYGTSLASAEARDKGGVVVDGTTINAQTYYQTVGSRQGALAQYVYSATNIRLREASFGYTFPGAMFNNKISNIRLALTGRNLFFFYLKAPFDPETVLATDNTLGGLGLFQQPSVRTIGFNVSAKF
jgi:TonB-linked SusC/RagA family outer membrane protein